MNRYVSAFGSGLLISLVFALPLCLVLMIAGRLPIYIAAPIAILAQSLGRKAFLAARGQVR